MVGMKAFTFFAFCFVCGQFLSGIMDGQTCFAVTYVSAPVTIDAVVVNVGSTTDFMDLDEIYIGSEKIRYTHKTTTQFRGLTRGIDSTTATAHNAGTKVKNETSNVVNSLIGYNIAATSSTYGTVQAMVGLGINLVKSLPRMIAWNYSYLEGQLAIIKYLILWPISAGFVFSLGMLFIGAIQGIFRR